MSKFNFIYAEDLSHREKTVYIYLRDRADASGVCWPGIKTIAGELGLSPRTVQRDGPGHQQMARTCCVQAQRYLTSAY